MIKSKLKAALQPVRELLRENPQTDQAWLSLLGRFRAERGRVGHGLASFGSRLEAETVRVRYVGGEIGTTSARITWHFPAIPEKGFVVELTAPERRTVTTLESFAWFENLQPHTVYRGTVTPLDERHAGAPFSFWTRPRGVAAYVTPLSAEPGQEVDLFISSEHADVTVTLRPLLHTDCPLGQWRLKAGFQFAPNNASGEGCRWQRSMTLKLPADAPSGLYIVHVECAGDGSEFLTPLIVRPTQTPEVAVLCSTNTWSAYNDWGGYSLYENRISAPEPLWVTWARPNYMAHPFGKGTFHLQESEWHVHRHLERHGIGYGTYSDDDMSAGRLFGARTVVFCGHQEYWCDDMMRAFDRLQAAGTNIVCLSGNTMFRHIVREPAREAFSRMANRRPQDVGPRLGTFYDARGRETGAPYRVTDARHWIYEGTGVGEGDLFGAHKVAGLSASGMETDKVTEFSAADLEVVARGTNPDDGGAEFALFRHAGGGLVVNAGSITFCLNLEDPVIDRMVANVFRRLGHAVGPRA